MCGSQFIQVLGTKGPSHPGPLPTKGGKRGGGGGGTKVSNTGGVTNRGTFTSMQTNVSLQEKSCLHW